MQKALDLGVEVYALESQDRHRWREHDTICRGQAPHPHPRTADAPMDFHLAIADGGALLVLFRAGYRPQAIRMNELVATWLQANTLQGREAARGD